MTNIFRPHSRAVLAQIATENIDFFSGALANGNSVGLDLAESMAKTVLYTPQAVESQSTVTDHQVTITLKLVQRVCSWPLKPIHQMRSEIAFVQIQWILRGCCFRLFCLQVVRTVYEITHERTCSAALRLCREGCENPAVLVFASAKNPGGGYLNGSAAQEESVCRSSGLYQCLNVLNTIFSSRLKSQICLSVGLFVSFVVASGQMSLKGKRRRNPIGN